MTAPTLLADLMESVKGRPFQVRLSWATERRVVAAMQRFNAEDERMAVRDGVAPDPLNPGHDDDLAVMCLAMLERGLACDERDAGLWATLAGELRVLPRPNRMGVRRRVRWAWREARAAWRAL